MITIERLQITEHEAAEFVNPADFVNHENFLRERAYAKDFKVLRARTWIGGNSQKKEVQAEYKMCKREIELQAEDYRKHVLEMLLAHLAAPLLENNGGKI